MRTKYVNVDKPVYKKKQKKKGALGARCGSGYRSLRRRVRTPNAGGEGGAKEKEWMGGGGGYRPRPSSDAEGGSTEWYKVVLLLLVCFFLFFRVRACACVRACVRSGEDNLVAVVWVHLFSFLLGFFCFFIFPSFLSLSFLFRSSLSFRLEFLFCFHFIMSLLYFLLFCVPFSMFVLLL